MPSGHVIILSRVASVLGTERIVPERAVGRATPAPQAGPCQRIPIGPMDPRMGLGVMSIMAGTAGEGPPIPLVEASPSLYLAAMRDRVPDPGVTPDRRGSED